MPLQDSKAFYYREKQIIIVVGIISSPIKNKIKYFCVTIDDKYAF